jgi:hypothetical protein
MPSLGSHMVRARQIADALALEEIDADRGAFILGSTAPDIRVVSRGDRSNTHFFDLDNLDRQDSVERMFGEHPHYRTPAGLDTATAAFIAGYITHLVLDEAWIEEIYRPSFGVYSDIDADPRSNVLDRVLQYELDRRDRIDDQCRHDVQGALAATAPPKGIPFIEDDHLDQWFQVVTDVAGQAPDYSRFRRMMSRHLAGAGYTEDDIDACCADPAAIVDEAFGVVTPERIERFWEHASDLMHDRVRRYLR